MNGANLASLEDRKRRGKKAPTLDLRPDIDEAAMWVWEAWSTLCATRTLGFSGPDAVKLGEIQAYCELMDITNPDDREHLLSVVLLLDETWLKHFASKRAKAEAERKANAKGK